MSAPTQPWVALPEPTYEAPVTDVDAMALGTVLGSLIALGEATQDKRSRQVAIGSSEVGWLCDRRIVYRLSNTPKCNVVVDPLRRIVGKGVHLALADIFIRLDAGTGWFKVEFPIVYRDIPGTADLVYCAASTVIDWKSTTSQKIARIRREGVPKHYQVQAQLYAAGLSAMGIAITHVAVVYVPIDGALDGIYVWRAKADQRIADDAVQRLDSLREVYPRSAAARPDRLCRFCNHYLPGSTNLAVGCPGTEKGTS